MKLLFIPLVLGLLSPVVLAHPDVDIHQHEAEEEQVFILDN